MRRARAPRVLSPAVRPVRRPLSWIACVAFSLPGCNAPRGHLADAFPTGRFADPWMLTGSVWSGTLEEAAAGLGDDAEAWRPLSPTRVWLAVYQHVDRERERLTIRCFAFASEPDARSAYEHVRPAQAAPCEIGDEGFWTDEGLLFVWGRLVGEIFGSDASWESQVQAAFLSAQFTKRMPAGVPRDPR